MTLPMQSIGIRSKDSLLHAVGNTKNFDPILKDYAFFEAHATEQKNDLLWYSKQLKDVVSISPALSPNLGTSFDLIIVNHVLYFVPNLQQTTKELAGLLTTQGKFSNPMLGSSIFLKRNLYPI